MNGEDAPYSGANESKCQGDHKWQLKCLPASLAQLKKELHNSSLSLEEKLILHTCTLGSVKHSSGSYESASETSEQCQDKLQKLLSFMCSYEVYSKVLSKNFFLSFAPTVCTSRKGRPIEQPFSKCQETQRWTCSPSLEVHTTVSAQISAFLPDDTIFVENMKTICPVFKNRSCSLFFHGFLPRKLSTNTVFFLLSTSRIAT